jgi:hypothetical protein
MRADLIMAWLQQQLARERPDTFAQTGLVRRYEACKGGADHTFFAAISCNIALSRLRSATSFLSLELISSVNDAVMGKATAWQTRPLEPSCSMML